MKKIMIFLIFSYFSVIGFVFAESSKDPKPLLQPPSVIKKVPSPPPSNKILSPTTLAPKSGTTSSSLEMQELKNQEIIIKSYFAPYDYDSDDRRNPFKVPRYRVGRNLGDDAVSYNSAESLRAHKLDNLTLVGIIWDSKNPRALFKDSKGKVWRPVGVNERVGDKEGYVAVIRKEEVVVVQSFLGADGKAVYESKVLRVQKKSIGNRRR